VEELAWLDYYTSIDEAIGKWLSGVYETNIRALTFTGEDGKKYMWGSDIFK
jgi:hypothetical protein